MAKQLFRQPLTFRGTERTLVTYAGIGADELAAALRASFTLDRPVVGVLDAPTGRFFPLSLLALAPASFAQLGVEAPLTLVLSAADFSLGAAARSTDGASGTLAMRSISFDELIRVVRHFCGDGLLNDERLALVLRHLWEACPAADETMVIVQSKLARIFALFDAAGTSQIAAQDFVAAAAMMCGGTLNAKIAAIFALYDGNADGMLSQNEVQRFLHAKFTADGDDARSVHFDLAPAQLATQLARDCFQSARAARGLIDLATFRQWFLAMDDDAQAYRARAATRLQRGGDVEEIFNEFDADGDNQLDYTEATEYFASVFGRMYAATPGMEQDMGVSALELAEDTAQECFAAVGVSSANGGLSRAQFEGWYYDYEEPSREGLATVRDINYRYISCEIRLTI